MIYNVCVGADHVTPEDEEHELASTCPCLPELRRTGHTSVPKSGPCLMVIKVWHHRAHASPSGGVGLP